MIDAYDAKGTAYDPADIAIAGAFVTFDDSVPPIDPEQPIGAAFGELIKGPVFYRP